MSAEMAWRRSLHLINSDKAPKDQVYEPPMLTLITNLLEQLGNTAGSPSTEGAGLGTASSTTFFLRYSKCLKMLNNMLVLPDVAPLCIS